MADDSTKKILIDVQLKNSDLIKRSAESREELLKLKGEQKNLEAQFKSGKITVSEYATALEKNRLAQAAYGDAVKKNQKLLDLSVKQNKEAEGSFNKLSAQYESIKIKLNGMSAAERLLTEDGKSLEQESFAIYQQMIKLQEATGKHTLSVGDYAKGTKALIEALKKENVEIENNVVQLKQQRIQVGGFGSAMKINAEAINQIDAELQSYNQQLAKNNQLIQEATHQVDSFTAAEESNRKSIGFTTNTVKVYADTIDGVDEEIKDLEISMKGMKLGSKQFEDAQKRADNLRLKVQQARGKVDEFGDKEPKNKIKKGFDDVADAAAGVVGAVQLVEIAFGKSEKTAEAQARILQLVAIQQGIVNVAKGIGAVRDTAAAAATIISANAQIFYAAVVGKSTGAMKLFKIALAGTGIGAIVLLLGELIFNFQGVNKVIDKIINGFDEFTTKISGGSKVLKAVFTGIAVVLAGPLAPIILLIKLINDFSGTIGQLQNFINGVIDEIAGFTDRLGFLGKQVRMMQNTFNSLADALKSLDSGAKKYKPTLETLTKTNENFNASLERKRKLMQRDIDMAKAQGASAQTLTNMERKLLEQTKKQQQSAYDFAVQIKDKLIKQNSKLTDDQQKLFDEREDAYNDALIAEKQFQHDLNQAARDRAKERIQIERDLQGRLNAIRNAQIKDEFEQKKAGLDEQFRLDMEANEQEIKEATKKFGANSKIVGQLEELKIEIRKKFNDDDFALFVEHEKKLSDDQEAINETERQNVLDSFAFKSKAAADAFELEEDIAAKTFRNTGRTQKEIQEQDKAFQLQQLSAKRKYLEDQLALTLQFAKKDGRIFGQEELQQLRDAADAIAAIDKQIRKVSEGPVIINQQTLNNITTALTDVQTLLQNIGDVINADAQNRITALENAAAVEQNNIAHSTASQAEKEKKIQALQKKTALEKYKIELEQFKSNKALNIINTTIAGAMAIVQALAQLGPVAGGIAAALVGITTATQIGIIASQPEPLAPQFADGVIGIKGPGTGTSDSINANISNGESVMTEKATSVFHRQLAAMEVAVGNKPNYNFSSAKFASGVIGIGSGISSNSNVLSQPVDVVRMASMIGEEIRNNPPVVLVSHINKAQSDVVKVSTGSRLT